MFVRKGVDVAHEVHRLLRQGWHGCDFNASPHHSLLDIWIESLSLEEDPKTKDSVSVSSTYIDSFVRKEIWQLDLKRDSTSRRACLLVFGCQSWKVQTLKVVGDWTNAKNPARHLNKVAELKGAQASDFSSTCRLYTL